jgi:hypothetical protein
MTIDDLLKDPEFVRYMSDPYILGEIGFPKGFDWAAQLKASWTFSTKTGLGAGRDIFYFGVSEDLYNGTPTPFETGKGKWQKGWFYLIENGQPVLNKTMYFTGEHESEEVAARIRATSRSGMGIMIKAKEKMWSIEPIGPELESFFQIEADKLAQLFKDRFIEGISKPEAGLEAFF